MVITWTPGANGTGQLGYTLDGAISDTIKEDVTAFGGSPVFAGFTGASGSAYSPEQVEVVNVSCFYPGTLILTDHGEIPVEDLAVDALVMTTDGRAVPVAWLGRQTISMRFADPLRVLPIRIKGGRSMRGCRHATYCCVRIMPCSWARS